MTRLRFGPASESPCRFQRVIVGGPFILYAIVVCLIGSTVPAVMAIFQYGPRPAIFLMWLGIFVLGTPFYYLISPSRSKSREVRGQTRVLYLEPPSVSSDSTKRILIVVASVSMAFVIGVVVIGLSQRGGVAGLVGRSVAIALLLAVLVLGRRR